MWLSKKTMKKDYHTSSFEIPKKDYITKKDYRKRLQFVISWISRWVLTILLKIRMQKEQYAIHQPQHHIATHALHLRSAESDDRTAV